MNYDNSLQEKFELVYQTIKLYPQQILDAWNEIKKIDFPNNFKNLRNIVLCGMGGSALGARIVKSLTYNQIKIPFEIYNSYQIPSYVSKNTLVIISSYSGTTEETIESFYQANSKKALLFGITTGGKLAEILSKEKIPSYIIKPRYNPSNQPRMSIGYASGAILGLFAKLGVVSLKDENIQKTISLMQDEINMNSQELPQEKNIAKSIAAKLENKAIIIVASEHLVGSAYAIKNQFNESAKVFSDLFELPELNHHLLEGLKYPTNLKKLFTYLFFESEIYQDRIKKRYQITQDVVIKNGFSYITIKPKSKDKLCQAFETLSLGSLIVFYLTKLNNVDPLAIPWVDYFKSKLAKI